MAEPIFACGPGGGLYLLILGIFGIWIVSGVLFLANLCLLFALCDQEVVFHGFIALTYGVFALAGWVKSGGSYPTFSMVALLVLPAIVLAHFVWLVRTVRRARRMLRAP
jgi:hypothetical protein